jgi:vacuolar protein sorting-associated protein 41
VLEKALEICKSRNLFPEMVFLLGRMGNTRDALDLLVTKIKDVKQAIEFVEEHKDETLWKELVQKSLKNPDFVAGLLDHIGGGTKFVNPLELIEKIPESMKIANLKQKLIRIVSDYGLESRLREGTLRILNTDCVSLLYRANSEIKKASLIDPLENCDICKSPLRTFFVPLVQTTAKTLTSKSSYENQLIFFKCGHKFHISCSQSFADQFIKCSLCSNETNTYKVYENNSMGGKSIKIKT